MSKVWRVKISDHQYEMLSNAVCHMEYTDRDDDFKMFGPEIKSLNLFLQHCRHVMEENS